MKKNGKKQTERTHALEQLNIEEKQNAIAIQKLQLAELRKPFYSKPQWIIAFLAVVGFLPTFLFTKKIEALKNEQVLAQIEQYKFHRERDSFYATITFQKSWEDSAKEYFGQNQELLAKLEGFTIKIGGERVPACTLLNCYRLNLSIHS